MLGHRGSKIPSGGNGQWTTDEKPLRTLLRKLKEQMERGKGGRELAFCPLPFACCLFVVLLLTPSTATSPEHRGQRTLDPPPGLSALEQNRALLMLGLLHFEQGEYDKALKYFETLKGPYKILEEYIFYYLGQTLYQLERYEEALSAYQYVIEAYPETPLLPEVRKAAAEILLRRQQYGEAAEVLRELTKAPLPDKAEVYYQWGRSLEGMENWKEAVEAYQQILIYYPNYDRAAETEKRMKQILKEKGLPQPPLTEQMLYEGAKILAGLKAYPKAIDLYRALITRFPESSWVTEALFGMAEAYHKLGKRTESLSLLHQIAAGYKEESLVARALYEAGNLHENREALLKVLTEYPKSAWADKALYLLGQLSEKQRRPGEAAGWYAKIQEQYPGSALAEEALWRSGWNYYQIGAYSKAEAQFAKGAQIPGTYRDDALYWKGRSAEKQSKIEEAKKSYQELARAHGESYYAVLAEMRLETLKLGTGEELQQPDGGDRSSNAESPTDDHQAPDLFTADQWLTLINSLKGKIDQGVHDRASVHLPKALELNRVNLNNYAAKELQYILEGFNPQAPSREDLLFKYLMGCSYYEIREYLTGINLATQIEETLRRQQIGDFPYKLQKLKYPLAYWKEIQKYSEKNGLDPFLVAGLIRQESAYNIKALSTSNAIGLMQIIPPTGKYIAERIAFKSFTPGLLYEPEINISFGTWYLAYLMDRFGGNVFKAVASYNAGPGAIERWWKEFDALDPDEVVENIPFRETRNYVKLVLRNRAVYRRIYGNTPLQK